MFSNLTVPPSWRFKADTNMRHSVAAVMAGIFALCTAC
jgi:hypothetical protein